MYDHFIVQRRFYINADEFYELNTQQYFGMFVYLFIYTICLMLVLQLMYRFLNATLTSKFNLIQRESTLQWRLNFARQTLRSEFMYWGNAAVGDEKGNYQFLDVKKKWHPPDDDEGDKNWDYVTQVPVGLAVADGGLTGSKARVSIDMMTGSLYSNGR